jgi:hypothetical protein
MPTSSTDLVPLGDQLDDLHVDIRKAGPERGDPAPGRRGQLGRVELVDRLHAAVVEDLGDQPADDRLVGLFGLRHARSGFSRLPAARFSSVTDRSGG